MNIERDDHIQFHEEGTLTSVTRWISGHDEGIAEWLKNARRVYQPDRADVNEEHRSAVLLFKDAGRKEPGRIGLLDVGGATLDDVTAWSTWQDPTASGSPDVNEEITQGNGGKTYMFKLFSGATRILGVREGKLNCKGMEGHEIVERGTPGFVPDVMHGREVDISSVRVELKRALETYGIDPDDLPKAVQEAIQERESFTLVEGVDPKDFYKGRIPAEELVKKTLRQDQSSLAIQQLRLYGIHKARLMNEGKPFELARIEPFPGVEGPFVYPIPEELPLPDGGNVSTTDSGKRPAGRLTLHTAKENMHKARTDNSSHGGR